MLFVPFELAHPKCCVAKLKNKEVKGTTRKISFWAKLSLVGQKKQRSLKELTLSWLRVLSVCVCAVRAAASAVRDCGRDD